MALSAEDWQAIGAEMRVQLERALKEQRAEIIFARVAVTATPAQVTAANQGSSPISSRIGPNGTQTMAAVILDDGPTATTVVWLPVRSGVTLSGNGGETVRIVKNYLDGTWAAGMIDCKP